MSNPRNFVPAKTILMILLALLLSPSFAQGQVNGQGQRPYMGWSSFSQQTIV